MEVRGHSRVPVLDSLSAVCDAFVLACGRTPTPASVKLPSLRLQYGACPGDVTGLCLRCQGELLGLWDPQNRDLRRKPPPETKFSVVFGWLIITHPLGGGVLISGHNISTYHIYTYRG